MSQENVEIVRRLWEEFQAGIRRSEPGAWFDSEAVAVDCEWIVLPPTGPGLLGGVWPGRDGFVEFMRTWTEDFDDYSTRVERLIDAGDDRVVALTRLTATGKGSGVPVEMDIGQVYDLEDGRPRSGEELPGPCRRPRSRRT